VIDAAQFVEAARERGFDWYAGVPCSYLAPFINYVLQDESLNYVSAANEGDAVALIAGVALGASGVHKARRGISMMQNSGLGNAVSPLTSLTWTFRLPQLLIVTWRGQPGVADEPQHALMGPLVMQKGSVAPYKLSKKGLSGVRQRALNERAEVVSFPGERVSRHAALQRVIELTPKESTVVLATTGFCGRELYAIDDRENQVYLVGSMGCVTPMALGLALSRPDLLVVALDGDGAALMRMGVFATLGAYGPSNLTHLLLDNGAHESTGAQATVSQGVEFARIASACGYALALDGDDLSVIDRLFEAKDIDGVRFARLSINTGTPTDLPRPSITPEDVRRRLQTHIGR
jgi:phosphonopyruvate decarboxylase